MAGSFKSRTLSAEDVLGLEPSLRREQLQGAMSYEDARTDDARLTLRLIFDSVALGATALNYVAAEFLQAGKLRLTDRESGAIREIEAAMVVNATGAWAGSAPAAPQLRPLRGSHFVFPPAKLPITRAVSWLHPRDHRPIFAYPWEGAVVYGTTDIDHSDTLDEPQMTSGEAAYLLEGLAFQFPDLRLSAGDAVSAYAGVRPVVASGKADPSAESRESAMWSAPGLVCITGGKLTTFRVTARAVLRAASRQLPKLAPQADAPVFERAGTAADRLQGRLGAAADQVLQLDAAEQARIAHTPYSWAELRWAARSEQVVHLTDLLMRRTRIGLVMEQGGASLLPKLKPLCQQELGWDDARWQQEERSYRDYWQRQHAPVSA